MSFESLDRGLKLSSDRFRIDFLMLYAEFLILPCSAAVQRQAFAHHSAGIKEEEQMVIYSPLFTCSYFCYLLRMYSSALLNAFLNMTLRLREAGQD